MMSSEAHVDFVSTNCGRLLCALSSPARRVQCIGPEVYIDFSLQRLYHGDLLLVLVSIQNYQLGCSVAMHTLLLLHVDLWCGCAVI